MVHSAVSCPKTCPREGEGEKKLRNPELFYPLQRFIYAQPLGLLGPRAD